jgi:hypothetical protein
MNTYTLHVPPGAEPGDAAVLDKADLVREGFSWTAFLFTFLWFFVQRLWLAGLAVLLLELALSAALQFTGVGPGTALLAQGLLSWLIGLEANGLKRWTYARRGRPVADVVLARDREEAEAKAFARWLQRGAAGQRPAPGTPSGMFAPVPPFRAPDPVIGLFPEPERRR